MNSKAINSALRMDLKSIIVNQSVCKIRLKSNEILVKSMVNSTKNLKILKSVHKILELATSCSYQV